MRDYRLIYVYLFITCIHSCKYTLTLSAILIAMYNENFLLTEANKFCETRVINAKALHRDAGLDAQHSAFSEALLTGATVTPFGFPLNANKRCCTIHLTFPEQAKSVSTLSI